MEIVKHCLPLIVSLQHIGIGVTGYHHRQRGPLDRDVFSGIHESHHLEWLPALVEKFQLVASSKTFNAVGAYRWWHSLLKFSG